MEYFSCMEDSAIAQLEQLAKNIIDDPSADTSSRLIAMMALDQARLKESIGNISDLCIKTESRTRRIHDRQSALITELNNKIPGFNMPIVELVPVSENGNGNGKY